MITFMESKERSKEGEKCLDSEVWHACAGSMVQMPAVNTKVLYFPQGHLEHVCDGNLDFGNWPRFPAYVPCRVSAVKLMADPETDEVFAKIRLVPVAGNEVDLSKDSGVEVNGIENDEKPSSFAKTLTQSDANNGGGFSVPRYCAETIFPRLDYSAEPPVQTILVKDVHGEVWKFRHIYRGTPRRHLLTTGWSTFVNQKKLVAGDSIVFVRAEKGDLCVGVRRAKIPAYGGCRMFYGEGESKVSRGRGEDVVEAASRAARGQAFDVVYYPRGGSPEFCVKVSAVKAALGIRWCSGMRFKMPLETEDSSRVTWFMGTVSSVQVADSLRWPDSPWRLLQVRWDEPELLQNVKRVNPWLVEQVSNTRSWEVSPLCQHKKLRVAHHPASHQLVYPLDKGMQGARHGWSMVPPPPPPPPAPEPDNDGVSCMQGSFLLFGQQILPQKQIDNDTSREHASSYTSHCKVFMESDDVGRTLDLSLLASYPELHHKLATMFHLQISQISNHIFYRDTNGALRQLGEEPFSKFTKSATRLRVVAADSSTHQMH